MKTILALILAASLSGCTTVHSEYTRTDGTKIKFDYSSPAFGSKAIKSVDLITGKMEGYSTDQSQMTDFVRSLYEAGYTAGLKAK